jgi:hypothetical protein
MNWLYYLLEANLYLSIFYGFYRLLLHKETFYQLNRYYLISAAVLAFILPLLQVSYLNNLLSGNEIQALVYVTPKLTETGTGTNHLFSGSQLITAIYLSAVFALFIRLLSSLYKVFSLALNAPKQKHGKVIHIDLKDSAIAFSFFNLLFINPQAKERQTILKHELVHIRQRHSLDILFFEFILAFNWFNPIVWMIKKDIQLLHEYIADDATTNKEVKKHEYAMFLIQNSFGTIPNPLTSQIFDQSILKRRINMLNKKRSAGRARLRLLYVLPLAGGMLCASTLGFTKDYATIDLYALKSQQRLSTAQEPKEKQYFAIESHYDPKTGETTATEKRLILLNGKKLDGKKILLIEGYDRMVELKGKTATDKYGKSAAYGALEFTGKNIKTSAKFPPPIVTKDVPPPPPPVPSADVKLTPPPPPPAPPKPKAKSTAVKFEGKNTKEEVIKAVEDVEPKKVYTYSIKEANAVNADMEGIKQVRVNANKDKNATTTFSYQISEKPEKAVEKVKSEVKEIKIDYAEREKDAVKPAKKDAKTELSIAIKKNISKEIEKAREAEANKKAE